MESNSSSSVSRPLFKRIGILLRVPFQALFQPAELEKSLAEKSMRRGVLWIHLALSLAFYTVLTLSLKLLIGTSDALVVAFYSSISIYLITLVIALIFGGVFKRDSLLSFVIGIYWGLGFFAALLIFFAIVDNTEIQFRAIRAIIGITSLLWMIAIPIALIANVRGRTGGILYISAFIIGLVLLPAGVYKIYKVYSELQLKPSLRKFKGHDTKHELIVITIPDHLEFNYEKLLGWDSADITSMTYYLEPPKSNDISLVIIPKMTNLITIDMDAIDSYLDQTQQSSQLTQKIRNKLASFELIADDINEKNEQLMQIFGNNSDLLKLIYDNTLPFKYRAAVKINGEIYLENNDNSSLSIDKEEWILINENKTSSSKRIHITRTEQKITLKQEDTNNGTRKPVDIAGKRVVNAMLIKHDKLFVQTDQEAKAFKIDNNGLIFSWTHPAGMISSTSSEDIVETKALMIDDIIYTISPSGSLFGVTVDGKKVSTKEPLYNIYALTAKHWLIHAAFYISLGVFILCLGLYQIPIYLLEVPLQLIGLMRLRRGPKDLDRAINKIPMFFDHVSTLPPAFGGAILRKIAAADPKVCAQRLVYLFVQTQHQRLAARLFEELHEANPQCLFANLYKWLRSGQYNLVCDFSQALSPDKPVGNLLRSYADLINQASKKPQLERHETLLRLFTSRDYHHAEELLLIYSAFRRFLASDSLQALAVVDEALAEPLKLTYSEVLIPQLYDAFNIIVEMANDLRNYDVVESYRDKQYYLSEARIKLYEISKKSRELQQPEQGILLEVVEYWQDLIVAEAKSVRGPADLEVLVLNDSLPGTQEWHSLSVNLKNVGKSPAENIRLRLLENEYIFVQETEKTIRLLGTGDSTKVEFAVYPRGNPTELRMFFDTQFDDFQRKNKLRLFADAVQLTSDVQEFRKAPNPYIVGTPLQNPKVFFGRQTALNFAVENLSAGEQNNALIFFGQRRVGKSSILYRLMETPLAESYLFAYIDCQGFADADTASLLYKICDEINKSATKRQIILESPDIQAFKSDPFLALDAYLDRIEPLLGTKRVALMFDEYEFLEYKVKEGRVSSQIFNKLRNLIQHRNQRFAFIFVGTHQLTELTGDYWSILFNIALYHEIGPLSPEAARALVIEPVKGYIRYDELAVDKILRATGLHPYFIQVTCRLIVNYCNRNQKPHITLQDVKEILKEAVEGSTAHVKYLYKDYATQPEQEGAGIFITAHRRHKAVRFSDRGGPLRTRGGV